MTAEQKQRAIASVVVSQRAQIENVDAHADLIRQLNSITPDKPLSAGLRRRVNRAWLKLHARPGLRFANLIPA